MNETNPYAPPVARVADPGSAVIAQTTEVPFFAVGIFKLVLMSVCTFGVYDLYWFYKNWQRVKAREGTGISPFWRAFFAVLFCYQCFTHVRDYDAPSLESGELMAGPLAAGWIILTVLWRLPDPYWLICYLAFVFLIPVQRRANAINDAVEPAHDRNTRLTWLNWVGVVLGGVMLLLILAGTFLPEEQ